jgi:hypothetical protein
MSLKNFIGRRLFALSGNSISSKDLDFYVGLLRHDAAFSFSRFGDGEWNAILGAPGANCDGHAYFPRLGADLRNALTRPLDYFYGMQKYAVKKGGLPLYRFLTREGVRKAWHDADVFHRCNTAGTLFPLICQLRKMKVVVIGPERLKGIKGVVFDVDHFIEIPLQNCYLVKDAVTARIREYFRDRGPAVFAFSASMASNVMIHELYPELGATSWLIDFGSLWDAYVGVDSRGGKSGGAWNATMKRNLGNDA